MNQVTSVSQIVILTLIVFFLHITLSSCEEEYNKNNLHGQLKIRRRDAIRSKEPVDCSEGEEEIIRKNRRRFRLLRRKKCNKQDEKVMKELEKEASKSKSNNAVPTTASKSNETYLTWKTQTDYSYSTYLPTEIDESKGIHFHWTIQRGTGTIEIGVAIKIDSQQGWAEIGFSDHGGRRGADFVHFTRTGTALPSLVDGYVLDDIHEKPIADKKQDWELIHHSITNDGYLIFEAKRDLDTKDSFDKPLLDDHNMLAGNHMIVGAWGSSPDVHYHDKNTVKANLLLFQSDETPVSNDSGSFRKQMSSHSDGSGIMRFSNYIIPAEETSYGEQCLEIKELFGHSPSTKAMYIVGFAHTIQNKHVHHLGFRFQEKLHGGIQSDRQGTWALHADKLRILPAGVGKKVGGILNLPFICMNVHNTNEDKIAGMVDSTTAIEFFYSFSPPKNTWYTLESLASDTSGLSLGTGPIQTSYFCPSAFNFPEVQQDEITIFQIILHAHSYAKRVVSQIVREGKVIYEVSVDYWEYSQKSLVDIVHRPLKVRKTDSIRTTCYSNTTSDVIWGPGVKDEMCNSFVLFYLDGIDIGDPTSDHCFYLMPEEQKQLVDESQFNRVFGND